MDNTNKINEIVKTQEEAIDKMLIEKDSLFTELTIYNINKDDQRIRNICKEIGKLNNYIEYSRKIIDSHKQNK